MNDDFGLLFAQPSFLEGLARAVDIGDTLTVYNNSESGAEADRHALRSDWQAVGQDLKQAMAEFRRAHLLPQSNG